MNALELKRVSKAFGPVKVIHGLNLDVQEGEFIVFVGPSGCGKSTLLRLIAGLEDPSGGNIIIDGKQVNAVPASERNLAMVFQSYALYPHMSVAKNLSFGLENLRVERAEIERRVSDAARLLQIDELLSRRPGQLSGGQRQRVAIGRAIVRKPRIFLFDEPLSNLDAELRVQMRVEISSLHLRLGNTMIYVTHDQVEAMTMADRIAVLNGGHLEQFGAPLDLYNRPANMFVAGFIGSPRMNFLRGRLRQADAVTVDGLGLLPLSAPVTGVERGAEVTYGIRPEHITLSEPTLAQAQCTAESVEQLGAESYLYCKLANGEPVTVHHPGQVDVHRGDTVSLRFEAAGAHVFSENGLALRS